jgi:hypothetical protein
VVVTGTLGTQEILTIVVTGTLLTQSYSGGHRGTLHTEEIQW